MRISARKNDPGFAPEARFAVVYMDGEKVEHVITADEEQMAVVIHPYENGRPVIKDDRFVMKVLKGDVKIRFRSDSPSWVRADHPDRIEAA